MPVSDDTLPVVVLVVDDDPRMLQSIKRRLEDEHTHVLTAHSSYQALQLLETSSVDIVISDEVMPGMSGVTLLEMILKKWPHTLRVLHTAYPWPETVIQSVNRAGVHKVLVKGQSTPSFIEIIRQLVNRCLAQRYPAANDG